MGEPAYQLPEEDQPDIRPDLRSLEGGGGSTPRASGHLSAVPDPEEDDNTESGDPSPSRYLRAVEGGAGTEEKLGRGYSKDDKGGRGSLLSRMSSGGGKLQSKTKKKLAIAGGLAAGSLLGSILVFFLMLPLKIESLVTNLETHFGAASSQAMSEESSYLLNRWIVRDILGNLNKGTCHSTVSSGCVSVDRDTGPLGKLYNGWRQGKLEQKLATKYDIVLGRKGGNLYIDFPGGNASIGAADEAALRSGKTDIFTLAEKNQNYHKLKVSRNEIRTTINDAVKSETLYNRVYDRFQIGRYLEKKYGIKRCVIACNIRDNFTDNVKDKKKLAKSIFIERVIQPLSANYAFLANCLLQGGGGDCGTSPDSASASDDERTSAGERKVQSLSTDLIAKVGTETAGELAKKAGAIADEGLQAYLARSVTTGIVDFIAGRGAGEAAGQAASKAIPFVGWVLLAAQIEHAAGEIGPIIKYLGYAIKSAAAVQTYYVYASAASEMKSGHVDPTELGSLTSALGSNMTGSGSDRSDATETPLYAQINDTKPVSNTVGLMGLGTASAATSNSSTGYKCNDGKSPTGVVCPEEVFTSGNDAATFVSEWYHRYFSIFPGSESVINLINWAGKLPGDLIGVILKHIPLDGACGAIPFCGGAKNFIESHAAELISSLMNKLIDNPVTDNMSGGRIYDMMAAGADVSQNQSCQVLLGCAKVDNQTAASIRSKYLAEQKSKFEDESLFARMFSTDTPYSLVSRVALAMPSSSGSLQAQTIAGLARNPISSFGSMLGNMFSGSGVFAADPPSLKDPFGVTQTAYTSIPRNSDIFWEQNCQNGPLAKYDPATQKLDVSDWLNRQEKDPETGQSVARVTNPCLLIYNAIIAGGAKYDASLLPPGSLIGSETDSTEALSFTVASYNMCQETNHSCPHESDKSTLVSNLIRGQSGAPALDIVGAQELSQPTQAALMSKLSGYESFPRQVPADQGRAIFWNTAKFSASPSDSGRLAGIYSNDGSLISSDTSEYAFPWVKLTTSDGHSVYVISIQSPNDDHGDKSGSKRQANARAVLAWAKQKASGTDAVVVTGDFNTSGTRFGQASSYCVLTSGDGNGSAALQHVHDMQDGHNASRACPTPNPAHYAPLDSIYASTNASLTASGWTWMGEHGVNASRTGTDHSPAYVTLSFPGVGGQLRTATFNVLGASHSPNDWQQRMDQSLGVLTNNHLDVTGMQELQPRQWQYLLDRAGGTYDIYPAKFTQLGHESENSIIWDKTKFKWVDGGIQPNLKYFNGTLLNSPWVKLQDRSTGQQFYVLNTHDPAHSGQGYETDPYWRYHDALEHAAFIQRLNADGLPIIYTGDFNSGYSLRLGAGLNTTYQNKNENLTYCIMTKNGLMNDAFDLSESRPVHCPNPGNQNGVDHVFLSPKIQVTGFSQIPPSQNGSDVHSTVIVDLSLTGSKSGGTTPSPGKDFVGNDGFAGGWCTDYVKHILARHSSKYHGGSLGDGKDFANNLGRLGYSVNHTPAVHAVVSFPGPPYGFVGTRYAGHVALVAQINGDGSIVVEESNFSNTMRYGTHKVSASEAKSLTYAHTEVGWH